MANNRSPQKQALTSLLPFDVEQLRAIEELPELEDIQTPKVTFGLSKSDSTCVSRSGDDGRPVIVKAKTVLVRPKALTRFDSGDYFADKEMNEALETETDKTQ